MQRIRFFDLARGLAIFFMIMQHIVLTYGTPQVNDSNIGKMFLLLGYSAAPVFLFLMGIFFVYSKKPIINKLYRGIKLFLLGYLLNFLYLTLPAIIGVNLGILSSNTLQYGSPFRAFFLVDILQFAGLAYIVMALLERFPKKAHLFLFLITIITLVSPIFPNLPADNIVLKLLWGADEISRFPLFPWLIYPLFGVVFGMVLNKAANIGVFLKKSRNIGFLLLVIATVACLVDTSLYFSHYCGDNPGSIMFSFAFILIWLPICQWLLDKLPNKINNLLFYWSKNVTIVYFIQWVIIGWGILLLGGKQSQELGIVLLSMVSAVFLTHSAVRIYYPISKQVSISKTN